MNVTATGDTLFRIDRDAEARTTRLNNHGIQGHDVISSLTVPEMERDHMSTDHSTCLAIRQEFIPVRRGIARRRTVLPVRVDHGPGGQVKNDSCRTTNADTINGKTEKAVGEVHILWCTAG